MNRIVIFGATGNTGLCALNSAVNKGKMLFIFYFINVCQSDFNYLKHNMNEI